MSNIPSIIHLPTINYTLTINSGLNAVPLYNYDKTAYDSNERKGIKVMSLMVGLLCACMMILGLFIPIGRLIII